jgi:hypothetical protein
MCGPNVVTDEVRNRIAACNARFREVSRSPFGEDDQIGMLNLIGADSMREIVSEADASRVFDLAVDYFIGMPSWTGFGDPSFQIWM